MDMGATGWTSRTGAARRARVELRKNPCRSLRRRCSIEPLQIRHGGRGRNRDTRQVGFTWALPRKQADFLGVALTTYFVSAPCGGMVGAKNLFPSPYVYIAGRLYSAEALRLRVAESADLSGNISGIPNVPSPCIPGLFSDSACARGPDRTRLSAPPRYPRRSCAASIPSDRFSHKISAPHHRKVEGAVQEQDATWLKRLTSTKKM